MDITWFDKYEKTLPCLWNKAFSVNRKNTKFSFHANQLASTNIQLQSWQAYKLKRPKEEFLWKVSKTFKVVARSSRFVFMTPKWNNWRKMGESSAIWICQNNFAKMTPLRPYLTYIFLSDKSKESTSSWILLFVFVLFAEWIHYEWKFQLVSGLILQLRGCSHLSVMQIVDCNSANFSSDKCAGWCVLHSLLFHFLSANIVLQRSGVWKPNSKSYLSEEGCLLAPSGALIAIPTY